VTSSARPSSRRCCPRAGSPTTTPSCSTAATTTGSPSYAYWYFKLYGHQDARLLDGGRKKWELDSRDLVSDVVERPATQYTAQEPDGSIRALRDEVLQTLGERNFVDVRSPDEFTGKLLAPRTCRRSSRSGRATSPAPATSRGRSRRTTTARSSRTTS
jgi:3-mercaptopyruvate sulfurtransferase SseA